MTSETIVARHSTLRVVVTQVHARERHEQQDGGYSGLCRCTGWPVIDAPRHLHGIDAEVRGALGEHREDAE